jgi:hypothetical protein
MNASRANSLAAIRAALRALVVVEVVVVSQGAEP